MAYKNKDDERNYQKDHYLRNKELYKQRASISRKLMRKRNSDYVRDIKKSNPCSDCNNYFHYSQMDFDHINDNKTINIARISNSSLSLKRIQDEINKCELVCANCHRLRTWNRLKNKV